MPQRVERIVISRSHPNWGACARLCSQSRKLGNCAVYILRHRIFGNQPPLTRAEFDRMLREQYPRDYRGMPSAASAQRQGQIIAKQFKSFAKASAEYKKHPEKFLGQPKLPGYRDRYRSFVVGRNGYKIENHRLSITGAESFGFEPLTVKCRSSQGFNEKATGELAGDLRIIPKGNSFVAELTYQKKEKAPVLLNRNEAAFIDLGVNNFAAIVTTKPGEKPILVKGGVLKSINQSYNKRAAQLRSKGHKKHLASVSFKREKKMNDAIHKISRMIIDYCAAQDLGRIYVGKNVCWKQSSGMGKRNNQNFVNIPHSKLIEQLRYKGEEYGIEVTEVTEAYTSQASGLDFDIIPEYEEGRKPNLFSGKRVKRGLYRSKDGKLVNADVNGAVNIGRKGLGNEWLKKSLGLDEGVFVNTPTVVRTPYGSKRVPLGLGMRPQEAADVSLR